MSDDVRKWLVDILEAIDHVDIHLGGQRDFAIYQNSITIQRAVEREIEIIGEATNRILKVNDAIAIEVVSSRLKPGFAETAIVNSLLDMMYVSLQLKA